MSFDELSACINGHGANPVELYRVKLFALIVKYNVSIFMCCSEMVYGVANKNRVNLLKKFL
jgi:hypothetical protein